MSKEKNILQEALKVTQERAGQHGNARTIAEVWAKAFSAFTGLDVRPEHYAVSQVCQKLARDRSHSKRENWVDIAGYARVHEKVVVGWIEEDGLGEDSEGIEYLAPEELPQPDSPGAMHGRDGGMR